jgi:alkanesulfonate monooxygenase SsuD/methylene tetrahydromethanopterin reductase-like flavin-dependent oxidoreductase (luciferase family)
VAVARLAEELGYTRVRNAEHHNMPSIASSATSVVIAHIGAHTTTIRLGSGGICPAGAGDPGAGLRHR